MPENICWASPERTVCYSFEGRLYKSLATANVQWRNRTEWQEKSRERWYAAGKEEGDLPLWLSRPVAPIYRIEWNWSEIDASEYKR